MTHRIIALVVPALFLQLAIAAAAERQAIRIAVYDDAGASKGVTALVENLQKLPQFKVERLKAADIQAGKLKEFDVLIQPGGSGSKQGNTLGAEGREQIRKFVQAGGGYCGICAGAYLASNDYDWSLKILDAKVVDRAHWARGFGNVEIAVTPPGQQLLKVTEDQLTIYYHQGPLLAPAGDPNIVDFDTLATYRGEIAKNGAPKGVMPGTTAIAAAPFGRGRVVCFSPHPEKTKGLEHLVHRMLTWAAAGETSFPAAGAKAPTSSAQ